MSPGSLRAGKLAKIKDELMYEKMQTMIKVELSLMRVDIEREMHATVVAFKNDMYHSIERGNACHCEGRAECIRMCDAKKIG